MPEKVMYPRMEHAIRATWEQGKLSKIASMGQLSPRAVWRIVRERSYPPRFASHTDRKGSIRMLSVVAII